MPLLRDMAGDPGIVDELVAAARACSAEVARLPAEENRRHIAVLFMAGLAAFERLSDPSDDDFAEATRLGADRAAQGVPLSALLSAVQAGRTRAFEIAVVRGRAAGIRDEVLLEAALEFDRYAGALERHVISGYRAAELELRRDGHDERAALLRRLLGGEPVANADLARFRLHPAGRYHCLVSAMSDPAQARALEQRWSSCGGLFGTVEGRFAGLTHRPPADDTADRAAAGQTGPGGLPGGLVVVSPAVPLAQAGAAYAVCVDALGAAVRFGRHGTLDAVGLAGEIALTLQPHLAAMLSDTLLGALRQGDEFHRELASTFLAYLDHGQRLDRTASALHVHPNTVRYRLHRLQEITGLPPVESVLETLRVWWALRTWLDAA
ncbi:PucR family transcriptional regulator [Dactylosporangium sp. NPDC000521]|uniref:PucR family transcriptional regulator n=1 Tax=Dactylosporangium sp. NPDC000521 TaxID=3363975 RepID=UPI0036C8CEF4